MRGHGRPVLVFAIAFLVVVTQSSISDELFSQELLVEEPVFPEWYRDTPLNDIHFVDEKHGVAIGERGLILVTDDGGRNWRRIEIGINCSLNSISFSDSANGFIVGGYSLPNYSRSKGVVLRTRDGGKTWHPIATRALPWMKWCKFDSANHGWAVGDTSPSHPSGIVETNDGGLSWFSVNRATLSQSLAGSQTDWRKIKWNTADEVAGKLMLATPDSRSYWYELDEIEKSVFNGEFPFCFQHIHMLNERSGFAVGNNNQIAQTMNGGLSWDPIDAASEDPNFPMHVDLNFVGSNEKGIWVAGNPGTYVYFYNFVEERWFKYRTGSTVAISKIDFIDSQNGWAVGEMGTILRTNDGGLNWKIQRGGNNRLSVLHIAQSANQISAELTGRYATENNWLCGVSILDADVDPISAKQAFMRLGVALVKAETGSQVEPYARKLARQIRQHRPQIVVIEAVDNHIAAQITSAVKAANNAKRFPHQITEFGLDIYEPPIVLRMSRRKGSQGNLSGDQFLTRVGRKLEDQVAVSRALMQQPVTDDSTISFLALHDSKNRNSSYADFNAALKRLNVDPVKRFIKSPPHGNLSMMRSAGKKKQWLNSMAEFTYSDTNQRNWQQGLNETVAGLDPWTTGVWLHQLVQRYIHAGQPQLAADTVSYMVQYVPNHPLLYEDLLWAWKYYSSDEYAMLQIKNSLSDDLLAAKLSQPFSGQTTQHIEKHGGQSKLIWKPANPTNDETDSGGTVRQVAYEELVELKDELSQQIFKNRRLQSQRVAMALSRLDFDAFEEPETQLTSIRLEQKAKSAINPVGQLKSLAANSKDALSRAAKIELDLLDGQLVQGVPLIDFRPTENRPQLDGVLDEQVWKESNISNTVGLSNRHQQSMDSIKFAKDEHFIYVGIQCRKLSDHIYEQNDSVRRRDEDLSQSDRITFRFDTDRDYCSWFELSIDWQGRVSEKCGSSHEWNPECYVARHQTDSHWIIEAAIRLDDLSLDPSSNLWALACSRHRASEQLTAWPSNQIMVSESLRSNPASFGYLRLEKDSDSKN